MTHLSELWNEWHVDPTAAYVVLGLGVLLFVGGCVLTHMHWPRRTRQRFGCRYCGIPTDTWTSRKYQQHQAEVHGITRRRREAGHAGATADWSPADEVADIDAHQLTPTELMPHHIIRPAVTVPDTDALEADVHDALSGIDTAWTTFEARLAAIEARLNQPAPAWVWRHRDDLDAPTGQWTTAEYQALIAGEEVTV